MNTVPPGWKSHIIKPLTGPDDPELQETLTEGLDQIAAEDLIAIADDLVAQHRAFVERLGTPGQISALGPEAWDWVAARVTAARRHRQTLGTLLREQDPKDAVRHLLFGAAPPARRVADFVTAFQAPDPRLSLELATGLLHYLYPEDHWLWTRWLWDVKHHTGILPLLAGSVRNLLADDVAQGYVNVGSVTAMSLRFAEGTGLLTQDLMAHPQRRVFAADAFLACAYCVYLYGITSWRLSREFHRLLPPLPKLARRLLGIQPTEGNGA